MLLFSSLYDVGMQQEGNSPMLLGELGLGRGQDQQINSSQELRVTSNPVIFSFGNKASISNFVSRNMNIHLKVQTYGN